MFHRSFTGSVREEHSLVDHIGDGCKDGHDDGACRQKHPCSVGGFRPCEVQAARQNEVCTDVTLPKNVMVLTRSFLRLGDGDGGAGLQRHAAGLLQGDVHAVGASFQELSRQVHLALCRGGHVVTRDAVHVRAAGV